MKYICENCGQKHNGSYASGRFCSKICAKGFSTKAKRKEINKKVSKTIKEKLNAGERIGCCVKKEDSEKNKNILITKVCQLCGENFKIFEFSSRKYPNYCIKCAHISPEFRKHASEIRIKSILSGKVEKFGKSRKCTYNFQNNLIRCDSKLEYCAIKYISETIIPLSIKRCPFSIKYTDFLGITRNFIPDFLIETKNKNIIMECKYEKINYQLNEKWTHYLENAILKKKALQKYCIENFYEMIWFTDKTDGQYKKIKQIKNFI